MATLGQHVPTKSYCFVYRYQSTTLPGLFPNTNPGLGHKNATFPEGGRPQKLNLRRKKKRVGVNQDARHVKGNEEIEKEFGDVQLTQPKGED
ncbi:unnamed protein product [Lactuca saligna]|uniref:Uncharacterized protein n=1 Tax=Lactuca saligna TaxID=75948 RepID=A0AA35ZQK9_LACSI|nr:unnamed protein product [Lactuca saligna]